MVELAREFGTPAYIVGEDDLRRRARSFVEEFGARQGDFDVLFASKAFPCTAVYRVLAEEGLSCDVASGGELALALRGGFDAKRIYFHGNAKSTAELSEALQAGVGHVVLDSAHDAERLKGVAAALGCARRCCCGSRPAWPAIPMRRSPPARSNSKFGFSFDDARAMIDALRGDDDLALVGLHFHIGSQLFELDPFRAAVRSLAELGDFPVYNLGGGLAVAYTAQQQPPAIADYVEALVSTAHRGTRRGQATAA